MRDAGQAQQGADWSAADWAAPRTVHTLITSRNGGVSLGVYGGRGGGMNLGSHVGDDPRAVAENRARLRQWLPDEPGWLHQVHGSRVIELEALHAGAAAHADAAVTHTPGRVCAVLAADCLPVLLCDQRGSVVAAAHAGWRGLAAGVLENTVAAMRCAPRELMAYLGPCIGPAHFEVGDEVRAAFTKIDAGAAALFSAHAPGKWLADLPGLARRRLTALGLARVAGGTECTYAQAGRFYSYRRDRLCGRIAALIWIEP